MRKLLKNKKAQGINYVAVTAFLFIFGFLNLVWYTVLVQFTVAMDSTGLYTGIAKTTGGKFITAIISFDWLGVLLLVGLLIALGTTMYRIKSSPVFFIITLLFGLFWGFISYFFNYTFIQMISTEALVAAQAYFPRTLLICTNLHWVSLAAIIIGSITLYAKKNEVPNLV